MRERALPVLVLVTILSATASAAMAAFRFNASTTSAVSTATLAPPTEPATAAGPCTAGVSASITVSWTPTTSTWADGYEVRGSLLASGPFTTVGTVSGATASSYTVTGLAFATTYHYVVRATKGNWRSEPTAVVSRTTPTPLCT